MKTSLLVMALSVCAFGQNSATTNGLANGRLWKSVNTASEKKGFLVGYLNGVTYSAVSALGGSQPITTATADSIDHFTKQLFPSSLTLDEISTSLDRFYNPPENGPITIASALEVISARASGADESVVQKMISDLLKNLTK